jgi:chromosome segregation ATPase
MSNTKNPAWVGAMLPALIGGAALYGILGMWMYGKRGKMTKLEKAFTALVIALGEKVEELEKRVAELTDEINKSPKSWQLDKERKRADEAEVRAERAETRLKELERQLEELHRDQSKRRRR